MKLFAFGSNGSGQLALGHTEDVSTPTQCLFDEPPATDDAIVQIAAGGNHTLLLTESGCVYAAGCNTDGRCGLDASDSENLLSFRKVVLTDAETGSRIDTFKCVSATWEGSILVASMQKSDDIGVLEARVFVMGSSPKGELGLQLQSTSTPSDIVVRPGSSIPAFPPQGTTVIALASGMGHTIAVLSNGDVYGWGGSRKGQLGATLKDQKIVWTPAKVEGVPFAVQTAVCGREFSVICGDRGKGEFVVLGDKANRWRVLDLPTSLRNAGLDGKRGVLGFSSIGASWHGIYIHAISDEPASAPLIAWGRNDRGQLPPENLPPPVKMAVGSEHVLVLMRDDTVAAFGWGEHGNCGLDTDERGNVAERYSLIPLDAVLAGDGRVIGLGAGCATSWIITE
jgi:protein ATS1